MFSIYEWAALIGVLVVSFVIDHLVVDRRPHEFRTREALTWVSIYVGAAFAFAGYLSLRHGNDAASAFVSGYITEYLLSIDNLFVFLVLLTSFAVPRELTHYVLLIGVVIALVLRGVLIGAGAALIHAFEPSLIVFAIALLWTAFGIWRSKNEEPDPDGNRFVRWMSTRLTFTPEYSGTSYRVIVDGARRYTPLLLVVFAIGTTDLLFALDSIPAVFGLTTESFIVFAVNAFALMGLRQLFFLLRGALGALENLTKGLALILGFIAVKLILEVVAAYRDGVPTIGTLTSLVVIVSVLAVTVGVSYLTRSRQSRKTQEHHVEDATTPGQAITGLLGDHDA